MQYWMIELLGSYDGIFYQSLFSLNGFSILAHVSYMNYGVFHRKFEVFTDVRIKTNHIHVFYIYFSHAYLFVQSHGLSSTSVYGISSV